MLQIDVRSCREAFFAVLLLCQVIKCSSEQVAHKFSRAWAMKNCAHEVERDPPLMSLEAERESLGDIASSRHLSSPCCTNLSVTIVSSCWILLWCQKHLCPFPSFRSEKGLVRFLSYLVVGCCSVFVVHFQDRFSCRKRCRIFTFSQKEKGVEPTSGDWPNRTVLKLQRHNFVFQSLSCASACFAQTWH